MNKYFKYIFLLIIASGCLSNSQSTKHLSLDIEKTLLGGDNIHGSIYSKKYPKKDDFMIKYSKWEGYIVESNQELEELYQVVPNCKAIKFQYRRNDGEDENYFKLSETIGKFKYLKYLHINSNRIKSYPKNIEELVNLEEIIIQCRNKEVIEFQFNNFKKLKHLTIHFADNLKEFPFSIFTLANIETLKLYRFFSVGDNLLSGIENLEKLKEINIWDSRLQLPDVQFQYPLLKCLILDRYPWAIPKSVWNQKQIEKLVISSIFNPIDLSNVSNLSILETLHLYYHSNYTNSLNLPKLEHLNIYNVKESSFELDTHELPNLESFVFNDSDNAVSISINDNNKLKSFTVVNNDKLEKIKLNGAFPFIKEFKIAGNKVLESWPKSINDIPVTE